MKVFKIIGLFLSILGTLIALSYPLQAEANIPIWSYSGEGNPNQWGDLTTDFAKCQIGRDQSPIDLNNAIKSDSATLEFNYFSTPLNIVNNGRTVRVNYEPGSSLSIQGKRYKLLQFHFHIPSEHAIENKISAMEIHFVHRNSEGEIAVVGVMVKKGKANSTIAKIWQNLPQAKGHELVNNALINAADLLPSQTSYFSYIGSLTTPPCSEGVSWNVLLEPISLSEEQIAQFESLYQVNARPVQSVNGRVIEFHE